MLGRSTMKMLIKVFNKKLVVRTSDKAKNFIKNVDPMEIVIAAGLTTGAVLGGAAGRKHANDNDSSKLITTVKVGAGTGVGAVVGFAAGWAALAAGTLALQYPIPMALTLFGGLAGSSLANRMTKSDSNNGVEKAATVKVKTSSRR